MFEVVFANVCDVLRSAISHSCSQGFRTGRLNESRPPKVEVPTSACLASGLDPVANNMNHPCTIKLCTMF